jgi:hypothetical protein
LRGEVASARRRYVAEKRTFDPVAWIGHQLSTAVLPSYDLESSPYHTMLVWDSISHPYIQDDDYRYDVRTSVIDSTASRRDNIVKLPPASVALIDAMAEAVGIHHVPGQTTYDLLPTEQDRTEFRAIHTTIARKMGI